MAKVWFITGAAKGFGRQFALAALERGDRVAATARDTSALTELVDRFGEAVLPLRVDVTDRTEVFDAVEATVHRFGRLDVVVNNAGYALMGAVEELGVQELRDQLETNLYGVVHVTQAVLPILRGQGSGHILQMSSGAGVFALGGLGGYSASKWAMEGLSEALAQEVAPHGIKVTLIEPGAFATGFKAIPAAQLNEVYEPLRASLAGNGGADLPGPEGVGQAILQLVDAEEPPLRVFFSEQLSQGVPAVYEQRLQTWAEWAHLAKVAEGR
ncbi:SDR family NAD(P)-dependent oxidoreductase [Streptomyces olindensis]|uniref:SDR family NAD(P)-dependent oxidoreductase n=1 Tax=Streptomyces olindensis TaxID=358823 RepID=UPI00369D4D1F